MSWEHLQDVLMKIQNKRVRAHFRDLIEDPDNDEAWQLFQESINLNLPRHSLWLACTIQDNDTATIVQLRMELFWMVLQQGSALHPPMYTIPTDRYQMMVRFAPQVTLYFKEDWDDVEEGFAPIDAQIQFRLMGESPQTLTEAELVTLANKIRLEFASGGGYRWQKGRFKLSYINTEQGYHMQVHAFSESEGRAVINKVLSLQGHTINNSKLSFNELAETPPIVPPMETLVGRRRRLPRKRPVGYVRFQFAEAHVWGLPNAIVLIDRTGQRRRPLVSA